MAPTLARRKNTEEKETHTHTPQAKLDRGTKWPQAWEAERTFLHSGHQMAPTLARTKNIETKETQAKDTYPLRLSQASPTTYDKGRTPLCE